MLGDVPTPGYRVRQTLAVAVCTKTSRRAAIIPRRAVLWVSRVESAQDIDGKAYRQNQANSSGADDRTANVKPAAAEQQKQ